PRLPVLIHHRLPLPAILTLDLTSTLAYDGICGRVSGPVPLVRWEQLVVDHALCQARVLTRPVDEIRKTLFARVDPRITDDAQDPYDTPHPSVELVLLCNSIKPTMLLVEADQTLLVRVQRLPRLQLLHHVLKLNLSLK